MLEEIQGDAYELYYREVKENKFLADIHFSWNVLRFFRLKNIRKTTSTSNNILITLAMLKNIIKVAVRNFLRQPGHSFLSVLGLTVSFMSAFLILLWIAHEYSYDQFHHEPKQIFKVMSHVETNGTLETYDAAALGIDVSSVAEVTSQTVVISGTRWPNELCFRPEGKTNECIYLNGIYAQEDFFSVFHFPISSGDPNPIANKSAIAISEKMAALLYANENAVGKIIKIDDYFEVTIASVFANVPSNSTLQFDFVLPTALFQRMRGFTEDQLNDSFFSVYLKTNAEISTKTLTQKLNQPPVLTEKLKTDKVQYSAFPFTDWRLHNKFENGKSVGGRISYVILFSIIALLIVVMAVINFINLSTARASNRAKEIGIRKVIGAVRSSIVFQFVSESFLIVVTAFLLAVILTQLTIPFFNTLVGAQISMQLFSNWIPLYLFIFLLVIAGFAGFYPALVMSSFQPVKVLKGQLTQRTKGTQYIRKTLLVVQLSVSIGIIIFSGVLLTQLDYITEKNLGFDRENMVRIEPTYKLLKQYDAFKNELLKDPSIKSVTATNSNPLNTQGHTTGVSWDGMPADMRPTFQTIGCNYEFLETFGITLKEGRTFLPRAQDSIHAEILVSEEAVRIMNLEEPIGAILKIGNASGIVIGIVNDFHTESLHNEKLPIILYPQPILNCSAIYIKYQDNSTQQAMATVQDVYKVMEPTFTMRYWFQDEAFDNLYKTEKTASSMVMLFTIISFVIAVVGVVGLATYNVIKKKKEIGVKRVFGASIANILTLLTTEFIVIVLIASMVAAPITWYAADQWLSGFAYRIEMPWWIYLTIFIGLGFLTVVIICLQALKTVTTNPTQTLRSE